MKSEAALFILLVMLGFTIVQVTPLTANAQTGISIRPVASQMQLNPPWYPHDNSTYTSLSPYEGSDNAEFGTNGVTPTNVELQATLSQDLVFTEPQNTISLQYNPDEVYSDYFNNYQWFQAGIIASTTCFQFTVQTWDIVYGEETWSSYLPSPSTCYVTSDFLDSGSQWVISEEVVSGYISSVYFSLTNPSGVQVSGSISAPSQLPGGIPGEGYKWLKSNSCWCGVDKDNAVFSSGTGTFQYTSNTDLYQIGPPTYITTSESSNMECACMSGSGTTDITQTFGLTGAC